MREISNIQAALPAQSNGVESANLRSYVRDVICLEKDVLEEGLAQARGELSQFQSQSAGSAGITAVCIQRIVYQAALNRRLRPLKASTWKMHTDAFQ